MKSLVLSVLMSIALFFSSNAQVYEWAKGMGGSSSDQGGSISIDASGNVYTTGKFKGTADFDPGSGTSNLTSLGSADVFISKLDASGDFLWAKSMGGSDDDFGNSITIDASGNVYTTGKFKGTVDFDPGTGTSNLTSTSVDIFISKLDSSGNFLWAKRMGGAFYAEGNSIGVDTSGNVYITGYFYGTADFDPGSGVSNLTSAGGYDVFISKLDSSGDFLWAKRIGMSSTDMGQSISIDGSGNVYTTGVFQGIVDFNPGSGMSNLTSAGGYDVFISKIDSSGNFLWAKRMGGAGWDEGRSISIDVYGNVYSIGFFQGTADFDPGSGTSNLISAGSVDVFISKLDSTGNFLWAKRIGGGSTDLGNSISNDASGNVYTTGRFIGTADFDPGSGTSNLISAGDYDIFISKLDSSGNFLWAKGNGGTGLDDGQSISIDNSGNVYTMGYFQGIVDFDPGIGISNFNSAGSVDVFISKLSPCYTGTDIQTACDSFAWIDANTYTTSNNTATHTLTNAAGCDSIVTLNLTINHSNTGTDTQTTCNSYTWIDGNTYTTSNNTATHTLTNASGCDSVITLDLTINIIDVAVSITSPTITANTTGATYQWLDCNNSYAQITGETSQSYTAIANGNYAVEVTENGCTDTSACVAIINIGINEVEANRINIFPNPTKNKLFIDYGGVEISAISIIDVNGKTVKTINMNANTIDVSKLVNGVYFLQIQVGDSVINKRFVKK